MPMLTKAGTFNAATAVGAQAITGVGFTPKALILWGVGATNEAEFSSIWFTQGIGFSTSPTNQYAQSSAAATNGETTIYRRLETCAFIQTNNTLVDIVRRANLSSMNSDGFTLNWTIARSNGAYDVVNYLALGGDTLTGASVVNWQMPTSTGIKAVTGVGFQPDALLHVHAGGVTALTNGGNSVALGALGLGVMTANGNQWATGYIAQSATLNARNQESDKCLTLINSTGDIAKQAQFSSMNADGFSLNFGVADTNQQQVISLALKGGAYSAGSLLKSTAAAPVSQAVTGVGFQPSGLLLAGVQDTVQATPQTGAVRYGLGASDGVNEFGTSIYGAATSTRTNIVKNTKAYIKDTGAKVIAAEADLASMDANGFTLGWTTNDAVETSILYLAMGSAAVPTVVDASALLVPATATATSPTITATGEANVALTSAAALAQAAPITTTTGATAYLSAATATANTMPLTATGDATTSLAEASASGEALSPTVDAGAVVDLDTSIASSLALPIEATVLNGTVASLASSLASAQATSVVATGSAAVTLSAAGVTVVTEAPVVTAGSVATVTLVPATGSMTLSPFIVTLSPALAGYGSGLYGAGAYGTTALAGSSATLNAATASAVALPVTAGETYDAYAFLGVATSNAHARSIDVLSAAHVELATANAFAMAYPIDVGPITLPHPPFVRSFFVGI